MPRTQSFESSSPFVIVGNMGTPVLSGTPVSGTPASGTPVLSGDIDETTKGAPYTLRIQSNRLFDDNSTYTATDIKKLLDRDLFNRVTEMGENLPGILFPDIAFGFSINDQFIDRFHGSFLSKQGNFDLANFKDEISTATFLNRTISTIAHFFHATGQIPLKPLRYFSAANSNKSLEGAIKRKPDIILVRLIDGQLRDGIQEEWHNVQALIEHTREKQPPQRMADTVSVKTYLTFCSQPERDFLVCLCITGKGFHIVLTDHAGQLETDLISFNRRFAFLRMLMGLAFLPDSFIGIDMTITRNEAGKPSGDLFADEYQPFPYDHTTDLLFGLMIPPESSTPTSTPISSGGIDTITIGPNIYKVIHVLFSAQTLIGRATKIFLVQLPDNSYGVVKDSWITVDRPQEATFLQGLQIPFGPTLVDHSVLRNTGTYRRHPIKYSLHQEHREKRRVVMFPAGVHISDFSSLWELLVAFLDIVVGMED